MQPNQKEKTDKRLLQLCKQHMALQTKRPTVLDEVIPVARGWKRTWKITHIFKEKEDFEAFSAALKLVNIVQESTSKTTWPLKYTLNSIAEDVYLKLPKEVQAWFTYNMHSYNGPYVLKNQEYLTLTVSRNLVKEQPTTRLKRDTQLAALSREIEKLGGWERFSRLRGKKNRRPLFTC
jgi:hypothetical protein